MSLSTDHQTCVFDFHGDDEGGFYRVDMTNRPGEINRPVMVNRGNKFQVNANLLHVVHGTTKGGGLEATLLVASFTFLPTKDKRFVAANITWVFGSDDPAVEISVANAAPCGSWSLCPIKQMQETNFTGRANAGTGANPVKANIEAEYSMKRAMEIDFHTKVEGSRRMENRDNGGHDAVRWYLSENRKAKTGICRTLQVAVLLHRTVVAGRIPQPGPAKFRGALNVVVDKGGWSETATMAKRVWRKAPKDEAVYFLPGTNLESGTFEIDKDNLDHVELERDIMFMSLHEDFEEVRKARVERRKKLEEQKREEQATNPATEIEVGPVVATGFPIWVLYVVLGVVVALAWRQIV